MMTNNELEIYFHIPFCVRKCLYCDFLSAPADEETKRAYMDALAKETLFRAKECEGYQIRSVFFGGGTPSVADAGQIKTLLELLRENYSLREDAEITIEVNPGTVDREKLQIYKEVGINRLSIGLQSSVDEELLGIGRIHTYEQFLEAYGNARSVGFTNINVDIMGALPGQSKESYEQTLERVIALKPEHISAYSLIVEEETPLWDMVETGKVKPWEEDAERELYWRTHEILTRAGYDHYEISNYALPGKECLHNVGYWERVDYLGLGIGAASLMKNERFRNDTKLQGYIADPLGQRTDEEILSREDCMEETMFLGLRMFQGVSVAAFENRFGMTPDCIYEDVIAKNERDGLLVVKDGRINLSPKGMDISNYVMAQFLLEK